MNLFCALYVNIPESQNMREKMEALLLVLIFFVLAVITLKVLAVLLHVGIFMLTLPFKLLGLLIAFILLPLIALPLGLLAGLAGIILLPLTILLPLLPIILIGLGLWALLRNI